MIKSVRVREKRLNGETEHNIMRFTGLDIRLWTIIIHRSFDDDIVADNGRQPVK